MVNDIGEQHGQVAAQPLSRIRVLELGHIIAGPSAGLILADLGADVIKIESPNGGDQARQSFARYFPFFNRNKRSVTLDLKSDRGKELFFELVRSADVVLDNFSPGVTARLGIAPEVLKTVNPQVVYLSIKGFLPGPYYERPSLDELAEMMGGLAFMTGPPGQPLRAGASIIDIGAAAFGVIGVLAGLVARQSSGVGQNLTSGLFETTVFFVGQWMSTATMEQRPLVSMAERGQGGRMGWAVYTLFECADGVQIFVGITSDAHWRNFCEAFDRHDLADDERLSSNAKRFHAREWLLPLIREIFIEIDSAELSSRLEAARVPFAPVKRPDELFEDEHLLESGQLLAMPFPGVGETRLPKIPIRADDYEIVLRYGPPGLGEHTGPILAELGVSEEEIATLVKDGVISLGKTLEEDYLELKS